RVLFYLLLPFAASWLIWSAFSRSSPGMAVPGTLAAFLFLMFGALAVTWAELPVVFIRSVSKLNERQREAACQMYNDWYKDSPAYTYYGRVLREGRWTTLQYHFFYAFNDWAHKAGLNYHEGDWEMVMVFLKDDRPEPYGVGYSAHHEGEFRRWADVCKDPDS